MSISDIAKQYHAAGLCVLPAIKAEKRAALSWKDFQSRLPTDTEIRTWRWNDGVCLIAGKVSGNLELIDFDNSGELFDTWSATVPAELLARCVIERSQSGGRHVVYRCDSEVCGNVKLAQGTRPDRKTGEVKLQSLIETRGEGGLFLCYPTPSYDLQQGDFCKLPVLTADERDTLLSAAYALNESVPEPKPPKAVARGMDVRPGDDFNTRGDVRWWLEKNGWTLLRPGDNEYWCRPGKSGGCSATLKDRVFYVFSSNASPFEPGVAYAPFSVYALLEHRGDYSAAAAELKRQGYGEQSIAAFDASEPAEVGPTDPGQFPEKLLDVPGFLGDVMAWNLACAKRKQPVLALAGALSLLALLTGRKVRDSWGTRTNLYSIGVCGASRGKDQARKCNKAILLQAGMSEHEQEGVASATGLVNAIEVRPASLFQLDEIGRMMQTLGDGSRNPHLYNIVTVLMRLYTSSDSHYVTDVYADKEKRRTIDQPHCVVFGTTVPKSLYEGLTPESISDGFMSRLLIFEGRDDVRMAKPELSDSEPPSSIVDVAKWWKAFNPGGNISEQHPLPRCIEYSDEAVAIMEAFVKLADDRLLSGDAASELWGRAIEKAHKLALLYACGVAYEKPTVSRDAAEWAIAVTEFLTQRMIFLASQWVSETVYDKRRKRLLREIQRAGQAGLSQSEVYLRVRHIPPRERGELLLDLTQSGAVVTREEKYEHGGRPRTMYVASQHAPAGS